MISRSTAEKALKECNYERFSIAPSISAHNNGISINVYFAAEVSRTHAYGNGSTIDGYIAPVKLINNTKALQRMIGYRGNIVVIDSKGNEYVGN